MLVRTEHFGVSTAGSKRLAASGHVVTMSVHSQLETPTWRARFSCRNTDWRTAPGRIPTACRWGRGGVDAALLQAMKATNRKWRCWKNPATWVMRAPVGAVRCSATRIPSASRSQGRGNAVLYLPIPVNAITGRQATEILNSTGYRPRGSSLTRILAFRRWPHATSSRTCFEAIPAALRRVKRRD